MRHLIFGTIFIFSRFKVVSRILKSDNNLTLRMKRKLSRFAIKYHQIITKISYMLLSHVAHVQCDFAYQVEPDNVRVCTRKRIIVNKNMMFYFYCCYLFSFLPVSEGNSISTINFFLQNSYHISVGRIQRHFWLYLTFDIVLK